MPTPREAPAAAAQTKIEKIGNSKTWKNPKSVILHVKEVLKIKINTMISSYNKILFNEQSLKNILALTIPPLFSLHVS